ncbi:MAG: hypothetical protein AAGA30_18390, partial [Planctomycetota bacterium]
MNLSDRLKTIRSIPEKIEMLEEYLKTEEIPDSSRIRAIDRFARLSAQMGNLRRADELVREGISLAKASEDNSILMRLYQVESAIACNLSDHSRGEKSASLSIELARQSKEPDYRVLPLIERGINRTQLSKFEEAIEDFDEAMEVAEHRKKEAWKLRVLTNLAATYGSMQQFRREAETISSALMLAEATGNQFAMGTLLVNLGNNRIQARDFDEAELKFKDAQQFAEESGNRRVLAIALTGIGDVMQHKGFFFDAEMKFQDALEIYKKLGDPLGMIQVRSKLNALKLDSPTRMAELDKLINEAEELDNKRLLVALLDQKVEIAKYIDDWELTYEILLRRQEIEREIWDRRTKEV